MGTKARCSHLTCSHHCGFNYRDLAMECRCPDQMQKTRSGCTPVFPAVPQTPEPTAGLPSTSSRPQQPQQATTSSQPRPRPSPTAAQEEPKTSSSQPSTTQPAT